MKKRNAKLISLILATVMMLICFALSASAVENTNTIKSEKYEYTITNDNEKEIMLIRAYVLEVDENGTYVIPSEIDGYKVTSLHSEYLYEFRGYYGSEDKTAELNKIKELIIPEGIKEIDKPGYALEPSERAGFWGLKNLKVAVLPSTLKVVPQYMFADCKKLEKVTLPEGIKEIEKNVFYNCKSLKSIKLPNSLTKIGKFAFKNCKGLKGKFKITKNVKAIGSGAFEYCSNLTGFRVAKSNRYFSEKGGVLFKHNKKGQKAILVSYLPSKKTVNYKVPSTIEEIYHYAFAGSKKLKKIILPNSLEKIGKKAFIKSNVRSIEIPKSVSHVDDEVFLKCNKLKKIIILGEVEQFSPYAIAACKKVTVYDHGNNLTKKDAKRCGFKLVKI